MGISKSPSLGVTPDVMGVSQIRYAKTVPGHHIQVDVKFLTLKDDEGHRVRRFQYTAIDDATRVRALQIYQKHNQQCHPVY